MLDFHSRYSKLSSDCCRLPLFHFLDDIFIDITSCAANRAFQALAEVEGKHRNKEECNRIDGTHCMSRLVMTIPTIAGNMAHTINGFIELFNCC